MRYMIHLRLGAPLSLSGVHYVSIRLHGQSFLLHQIRKMMALLCATYRGDVADDTIETALKKTESLPQVPLAPSCALMLRSALYANYERKRANEKNCGRNSVHFPECEGAQQGSSRSGLPPHVAGARGRAVPDLSASWNGTDNFGARAFRAAAAVVARRPAQRARRRRYVRQHVFCFILCLPLPKK